MLEAYLQLLELGYYEAKFAFEGLADENVWKRPAAGLLSVGELAGHIAYWEAVKFAGEGASDALAGEGGEPDLSKCRVSSPLIDHRFSYYPGTIATPPSAELVAMTAEQVWSELLRVHEQAIADFKARNPDLASSAPGWPPHYTYSEFLKYAVFHVSYHTGQMFSARHLLGEETPDN